MAIVLMKIVMVLLLMGGWAWTKVRRANPEYPATPDYDVVYALYPED